VAHRTHPDVQWLTPGSVTGYLVDQVRDLIEGVNRAPSRARAKAYVLENAGLLRGTSANALLKTIEEPPEGVVFILLARSVASVLPTIVSRCQVVPFRTIAPSVALDEVMHRSGASEGEARVALSVAGTPSRACDFLASPSRREVRRLVVRVLDELGRDDSWDVLCSARDLLAAVRVPLKDVQVAQDEAAKESADFLTASALKQVADANKRELTARERSGYHGGSGRRGLASARRAGALRGRAAEDRERGRGRRGRPPCRVDGNAWRPWPRSTPSRLQATTSRTTYHPSWPSRSCFFVSRRHLHAHRHSGEVQICRPRPVV
jgi:hypothetical protein